MTFTPTTLPTCADHLVSVSLSLDVSLLRQAMSILPQMELICRAKQLVLLTQNPHTEHVSGLALDQI